MLFITYSGHNNHIDTAAYTRSQHQVGYIQLEVIRGKKLYA